MFANMMSRNSAILENSAILKKLQKKYPDVDFLEYFYNGRTSDYHIMEYLQTSLQDVADEVTLMVMSPEDINFLKVVATTALIQNNIPEKNFYIKLIEEVVTNKLKEGGLDLKKVQMLSNPDYMLHMFASPMYMYDNAFSCSIPYDVVFTKDGIEHKKAANFIVLPHYSNIFPSILGWDRYEFDMLKKKGISLLECYMSTAYHEAGHSMDPVNALKSPTIYYYPNNVLANYDRYRTECVADVFSALMMAKTTKKTDFAEIDMMARAKHLYQQYRLYHDINNNELTFLIEKDVMSKFKKAGYSEELIKEIVKTNDEFKMRHLWSRTVYYTAPSIDKAIQVAQEMIKDGSIDKMTARDIKNLSVEIAESTMFERNHIVNMFKSIIKGDTDNELFSVMKKYTDNAYEYFGKKPERSKKYQKQIKEYMRSLAQSLGLQVKETDWDRLKKDINNYHKFDLSKTNRKLYLKINDYEQRLENHIRKQIDIEVPDNVKKMQEQLKSLYPSVTIDLSDEFMERLNEIYKPDITEEEVKEIYTQLDMEFPEEVALLSEVKSKAAENSPENEAKIDVLTKKINKAVNKFNASNRMKYTLECLNFANKEIDDLNNIENNSPTTTLTNLNLNNDYKRYIKLTSINHPYWVSTNKMREISFKDGIWKAIEFKLSEKSTSTFANAMMNYFYYKSEAIKSVNAVHKANFVEPRPSYNIDEVMDKKQKLLNSVTQIAFSEKVAESFASEIMKFPEFALLKEKHSQCYNHIINTANGKTPILSCELYNDVAFGYMPNRYAVKAETKMIRDMLSQNNLGSIIFGAIPKEKNKQFFFNSLKNLKGIGLWKKMVRDNIHIPKYSDIKKKMIAEQLEQKIR